MKNQYQVGQMVRFRLGERVPHTTSCCGRMIDYFDVLTQFSGQIFEVGDQVPIHCPFCHTLKPKESHSISFKQEFHFANHTFTRIGAYLEEVEPI